MNIFESILQKEKYIKFEKIVKNTLNSFDFLDENLKTKESYIRDNETVNLTYYNKFSDMLEKKLSEYYQGIFEVHCNLRNTEYIELTIHRKDNKEHKNFIDLDMFGFNYYLHSKNLQIEHIAFSHINKMIKNNNYCELDKLNYLTMIYAIYFNESYPYLSFTINEKYFCKFWFEEQCFLFDIDSEMDTYGAIVNDKNLEIIIKEMNKEIDVFLSIDADILGSIFKKGVLNESFTKEDKDFYLLNSDFDIDKNQSYELFKFYFDMNKSSFFIDK